MSRVTLVLTGRPPVSVDTDRWALIAEAEEYRYDGQYEAQANWSKKWYLGVRQHEDGRCVVFARYWFRSCWANDRSIDVKEGVLLPEGSSMADVCNAIDRVAASILEREHRVDDAQVWVEVACECIADLPAEELL